MTLKMAGAFALAAALTASLAQQPVKPQQTAVELEPILAQVARFDAGQSREGLFHLTMFVQDSMSSPALHGQIEARLLQFLQTGHKLLHECRHRFFQNNKTFGCDAGLSGVLHT